VFRIHERATDSAAGVDSAAIPGLFPVNTNVSAISETMKAPAYRTEATASRRHRNPEAKK
jgi:hypothetical protein